MFYNYLIIGFRNLARHKVYSFINIAGLSLGLACCILILLFVRDEISYDTWLKDADRIYRVESTFLVPGREPMMAAQTPGPAKAALGKDFPQEIEQVVRIHPRKPTIDLGDRQFNEDLSEVDAGFFDVFDLPFLYGGKETALQDTTSLVLTESMARKFFGETDVIGRTLTVTREDPEVYRISAVIKDIPENSHLDIKMLSLFDPLHYADKPWVTDRWTSTNVYIYVKFKSTAAAETVAGRMRAFVDANVTFQIPGLEGIKPGDILTLNLQSVPRIHLYSANREGMKPGGDIATVYTFSAVAVLILLIASLNFMNLATARSMERAREVSMRKVVGAKRYQLVCQFLGESVMMTLLALAGALISAWVTLPVYNEYIAKHLSLDFFSDPALFLWLCGLAVFVGVMGGLYPAFYLSRFQPARILKSNQSSSSNGASCMRSVLVVLQFSISIGLIATTLVVYMQTQYARNMDPGFKKDHMVMLAGIGRDKTRPVQKVLKERIAKIPGVISVGRASDALPQKSDNNTLVDLPDVTEDNLMIIEVMTVDYDFFNTIGVTPLAGRLFSRDYQADVMPANTKEYEGEIRAGALINERARKQLGYSEAGSSVGRTFRVLASEDKKADIEVVGVLKDMHTRSVRHEITPMIFYLGDDQDNFNRMFINIRPENQAMTLREIDRVWNELIPDVPVSRSFVDEDFAGLYLADQERMNMFLGFALFSILVACLGLFGLAVFSAERRTKEIGLRKVLGASTISIVSLLVGQFSRPVLLANVIAWPVAWYFSQAWLENFKYRLDITLLPFVIAGMAALMIAWMTVSIHATRVARSNLLTALRCE